MSDELSSDYFGLFGLTQGYGVDRETLDERFRTLQHALHPDRFASAPDQERRIAMQKAAHVAEAYRVLKDPIARGRYVLEQRGHEFRDQQTTHQDPAFLMEQMELREALGEIRDQDDPLGALTTLIERIEHSFERLDTALATVLEKAGDASATEAVDLIQRMQFFRRLMEEAAELEASLEEELDDE